MSEVEYIIMPQENISQVFRLKIYMKKSYLIEQIIRNVEEIIRNELMNKKHTKVNIVFNYNEHLLILISILIYFNFLQDLFQSLLLLLSLVFI